ncbi:MAG: EAL domain-containing protein [Marinomonas sp.]
MNERSNVPTEWLMAPIKRYVENAYLIVFFTIFVCGIATSLALLHEEKQRLLFDEHVAGEQFVTRLKSVLGNYGREVTSFGAMIQSMDEPLTYDVFQRFSRQFEAIEKNKTLRIYFAQYVPLSQLDIYLKQQQGLAGQPNFQIIPTGPRDEYLPLTYGYPFAIDSGFDLLSDGFLHHDLIQQVRGKKSLSMTKPLAVASEAGIAKPDNFVLRRSIYIPLDNINGRMTDAAGFYGLVGVIFNVSGLKQQLRAQGGRDLSYRIAEVTENSEDPLWFAGSSLGRNIDPNHQAFWQKGSFNTRIIHYGGCDWRVDTRYSDDVFGLINWGGILSAFIIFTFLAMLLSWYVRLLSNAYKQTLRIANDQIEIDELTGLFSRYKIQVELDKLISHCQKKNMRLAAFFLDLDRFKTINDVFGHETGDWLLIKVAQRLRSIFPEGSIIGRLGGDEFLALMVLDDQKDRVFLEKLCKEVIIQVGQNYFMDDRPLNVGCSVGVALYPDYGLDAETLVKNADMAMYKAKTAGRATYYFYDDEMGQVLSRNMRIETRLRRALQNDTLQLHYQPKVDLETQKCVGMEALLRWEDSELGVVSPVEFIPVAEQTGIILTLGEWVIEQACKHIVAWQKEGIKVPPIAINCSAAQLKRANFLAHLLGLLNKYKLDPSVLELEVTESILIEDAEGCAELLRQVSQLGMKLAIDDFGTGYSSLSYLKDLPFDYVKIDQVFIRDLIEDSDHDALTRAIISLSHDLNLTVIAEGITRDDQLNRLRSYGCDIGQGYLFSRAFGADSMGKDPMIIALNQRQGNDGHLED